MPESEILVYVDLRGTPRLAGHLWFRTRKNRQTATFEYDPAWLENQERFALEPALTLGPGPFQTQLATGAIGDSAPDRWGRILMRRAERIRAERAQETPRTLSELDFLLMVNDETRQGALRFTTQEAGPFLAERPSVSIPPLLELPRLLSAADRIGTESDTAEDLKLLLAPGSSLGGARPKASVRDNGGELAIAKFPKHDDEVDRVRWEAVALTLASHAGIRVPDFRVVEVANRAVLLLTRFDRHERVRIPYLSALSMLGAEDRDTRSYLEIADALRQYGASTKSDIAELWRRIVFTVLISNVDDHLRNHGFLYSGTDGWRLSPAFDLNPVSIDEKPRILSTAIDPDDTTASLELAMSVAEYFDIDRQDAKRIAREVGAAVKTWRGQAARLGVRSSEIDRMASAFEHADLRSSLT